MKQLLAVDQLMSDEHPQKPSAAAQGAAGSGQVQRAAGRREQRQDPAAL